MVTPSKPGSTKSPVPAKAPTKAVAKPAASKPAAPVAEPGIEKADVVTGTAPAPTPEPTPAPPIEWPVPGADAGNTTTESEINTQVATPPAIPVKKGDLMMTDVIETAKTYAEEAKSRIQSAVAELNDKAKVALEKGSKAIEEVGEITKGNLEALVESSKIAAKGVETLGQDAAEYGRKSFEKTSATLKSFASVKSPAEFFQLQTELLTSSFDTLAAETAKSSETFLKLAGDIAKPISTRVAVVSEKVKTLAA